MAARRLIIVMLVLLFVSTVGAALSPVQTPREPTTTDPPAAPAEETRATRGRLVSASVGPAARSRPIRARVGDQLELRVSAPRPVTLELAGLGVAEDAGPVAPARFDLLLTEPGRFPLRPLGGGRPLAVVDVADRAAPRPR